MSPRAPFRRTWLRYMPVIPASASAAIRTFREFRMTSSVVVMEATSTCGSLMLTPMKIAPAAAAQTPAAWGEAGRRDRHGEVPFSLGLVAGRMSDGVQDGRNRRGAGTSPHDVTRGCDFRASGGLEQTEIGSAADGGRPSVHVELGEDALGVGAQGVDRHEQLACDLGAAQGVASSRRTSSSR